MNISIADTAGLLFLLYGHGVRDARFELIFAAILLVPTVLWILWERRYRRLWKNYRARTWKKMPARFDDGEIITMRKGRSNEIAGYRVRMMYTYQIDEERFGFYELPFTYQEFPNEEEAEVCRKLIANKDMIVRVSPRNPSASQIVDDDIRQMLTTHQLSNCNLKGKNQPCP